MSPRGDDLSPSAPVVVLLRRLQARPDGLALPPGPPIPDVADIVGRCEGGALAMALDAGRWLDAPVIAVAAGPARREERVLAMALRAGCAQALRIDDEALGEADYLATARLLAAAVAHLRARLVVCGDRSSDEGAGAIGPAVAERLGWPHLTGVGALTLTEAGWFATRSADGARLRLRLPAPTPAVLCAAAPRPTDGDARAAGGVAGGAPGGTSSGAVRRRPTPLPAMLDALTPEQLGVDLAAWPARRAEAGRLRPVRAGGATAVTRSVDELVARLRADRLLGASR